MSMAHLRNRGPAATVQLARTGCAMRVTWGLVAASLGLLTGCGNAVAPTASPVPERALPTGVLVAQYEYGSGDTGGGHGTFLSLFDEQSGKRVRDLVHIEEASTAQLSGFSRSADGSITYAMARGPYYTSNVSNGAPRPGSCGGSVYRIDARTGRTRPLFTVDRDLTVGEPAVSPDGKSVAYLSQQCTAAFANRVVVRDLATGRERRISVPRASATRVAWRSDGAQLVLTVMYPEPHTAADVSSYVVVQADADGSQPVSAVRSAPDHGCVVAAAVFAGPGVQLVEGCPNGVTAPARLVQLAEAGPRVLWRASTWLCPNGMTLAHDPQGRLLVTSTTTCGGLDGPVDVVQAWTGQQSRDLGRYVNPQQFVAAAA